MKPNHQSSQVVYVAQILTERDGSIRLSPVPLKFGMEDNPTLDLAVEIVRALGARGYTPNPDDPGDKDPLADQDKLAELLGMVKGKKRIPWKLLGPAVNPDGGTVIVTPKQPTVLCRTPADGGPTTCD
jgi:hypothetical protein